MSETCETVEEESEIEVLPEVEPDPILPNVEEWLTEWALPHYRRDPKLHAWDPEWWKYEEAGTVLETLWESWEQVRWEDPMTRVAWFRDYFYPIMDRLTDLEDGVFWAYDPPKNTEPPAVFETNPSPEGWF